MLPYLMAVSLIAGFVTAWLQSCRLFLACAQGKKVILLTLVVDSLVKLAYLLFISSLTG